MIEPEETSPISKAARNERRKAAATTCNALAVALLVAAFLQPLVSGHPSVIGTSAALVGFVALQGLLHYILKQVED